MTDLKKACILGIPCVAEPKSRVLEAVEKSLERGERLRIGEPHSEMLVLAHRDRDFHKVLRSFELRIPDSISMVWLSRLFGTPIAERIPGSEFMEAVVGVAVRLNLNIFLLGGARSNALAVERYRKMYPTTRIEGSKYSIARTGRGAIILPEELFKHLESMGDCLLLVALGMKHQEELIAQFWDRLPNIRVAIGVGGAFDMVTGLLPRAPGWLRRLGLEWLWRLWLEPRRLGRIFRAVVIFPVTAILYEIRKNR